MNEEEVSSAILDLQQRIRNLEVAAQEKPKTSFLMPFGKYKGKPLTEVPKNYVEWIKEQGVLEKDINAELKNELAKLGMISA